MEQFQSVDNAKPETHVRLQASLLLAASKEALLFNNLLKHNYRAVPRDTQKLMLLHYQRFFTLFDRAGGNIVPKFHLMHHSICQIEEYGNPRYLELSPTSHALATAVHGPTPYLRNSVQSNS
jgi:hypothetical protein